MSEALLSYLTPKERNTYLAPINSQFLVLISNVHYAVLFGTEKKSELRMLHLESSNLI